MLRSYFLIQLILLIKFIIETRTEIVHIQAIWRHGDRSPLNSFAKDTKNGAESWPRGLEQLTTIGLQKMFELGQTLKYRYPNLINRCQIEKQVSFSSSFYNRTRESAAAVFMGMIDSKCKNFFKPIKFEHLFFALQQIKFNANQDMDFTFLGNCPTANQILADYLNRPIVQRYEKENSEFLEYLSKVTGHDVTFKSITPIWDALNAISIHHHAHKMPHWATKEVQKKINNLTTIRFALEENNKVYCRLKRGFLLWKMQEIFRKSVYSSNHDNIKKVTSTQVHCYSAHDGTIGELLSILGVYETRPIIRPDYSHCNVLELHKIGKKFFVKLIEMPPSSSNKVPIELQISGCPKLPQLCPWYKFIDRNDRYIIRDPEKKCQS